MDLRLVSKEKAQIRADDTRRVKRGIYRAGGAREGVCEKTGEAARMKSSGNGNEASGVRTANRWVVSGCVAAWWPRWQYGQCESFAEPWSCHPLLTTVANTSSESSANETPRTRMVFLRVILLKQVPWQNWVLFYFLFGR